MIRKIIIIVMLGFLASCATTKYKEHVYNGKNEIYPAVIKVFNDNNTVLEKIDLFKNKFLSGYVYDKDLLVPIRYKISVNFQAGNINIKFLNIQMQESTYKSWQNNKSFLFYDINLARSKVSKEIFDVLNNQKVYSSVRNELLGDLSFHYLVMKDFTEVATERWVKKNMKGRFFDINLKLENFKKNNTGIKENIKYVAKFSYMSDYGIFSKFAIRLYTNSDRYSNMKLNEPVKTRGKLIEDVQLGLLSSTYYINLIEN